METKQKECEPQKKENCARESEQSQKITEKKCDERVERQRERKATISCENDIGAYIYIWVVLQLGWINDGSVEVQREIVKEEEREKTTAN